MPEPKAITIIWNFLWDNNIAYRQASFPPGISSGLFSLEICFSGCFSSCFIGSFDFGSSSISSCIPCNPLNSSATVSGYRSDWAAIFFNCSIDSANPLSEHFFTQIHGFCCSVVSTPSVLTPSVLLHLQKHGNHEQKPWSVLVLSGAAGLGLLLPQHSFFNALFSGSVWVCTPRTIYYRTNIISDRFHVCWYNIYIYILLNF